jgi:hypothetical protein
MGMNMGTAALAVGAAQSAYQGFRGAQQSSLLNENAAITEANAPYVRAAAREKARQYQVASYLMQGRQKAGYAGAGLAVGGSAFDVMSDTAANYTRDASFAILEGELQVRGMKRQADLFRIQASNTMRDAIVGGALNLGRTAIDYQTVPKYTSVLASNYNPVMSQPFSLMAGDQMGFGIAPFRSKY